jgi:hypothetical protein
MGFRKTPGFSGARVAVPPAGKRADGTPRAHARGTRLRSHAGTRDRRRGHIAEDPHPHSAPGGRDFYGITVGPPMEGARINWLDENGRPGSRGIRLDAPVTRH